MKHEFSLPGYEDMELSTQLVIREALRRDLEVEVLDIVPDLKPVGDWNVIRFWVGPDARCHYWHCSRSLRQIARG